jgi:hypothetical protein
MTYKIRANENGRRLADTKDTLEEAMNHAQGWVNIGLEDVIIQDDVGNIVWKAP